MCVHLSRRTAIPPRSLSSRSTLENHSHQRNEMLLMCSMPHESTKSGRSPQVHVVVNWCIETSAGDPLRSRGPGHPSMKWRLSALVVLCQIPFARGDCRCGQCCSKLLELVPRFLLSTVRSHVLVLRSAPAQYFRACYCPWHFDLREIR